MSIMELLDKAASELAANPYTDRSNREYYARNVLVFLLQGLSESARFDDDERAALWQLAEALGKAGDVPAQGDPTCEQCQGQGCALCRDDIYYRQEDAAEQFRRDRTWDRNANHD